MLGSVYQYQRLLSYPTQGQNETQTHAILAVLYLLSVEEVFNLDVWRAAVLRYRSAIHSRIDTTPQPGSRTWTPAGGASMNWQGQFTSVAVSYSHMIASGGGLIGAVKTDAASASIRQQISRALSASLSGGYAQNTVVGSLSQTTVASSNGHTYFGNSLGATAVRPAPECAARIHAAPSDLQRRRHRYDIRTRIANLFRSPINSPRPLGR